VLHYIVTYNNSVSVYVCCMHVCLFVCSLITRERVRLSPPYFQSGSRAPREWFYRRKRLGVMGIRQKIGILWPCATVGRSGTGQAIGAHTGVGGQRADATEAGVGADKPARILHTGKGSGDLGRA